MSAQVIDLDSKVGTSKYFTWRECLWLPQWEIYVHPTDMQRKNLERFILKCDKVRHLLGVPMYTTSVLRPKKYNELIGGSYMSKHIFGLAMDFEADFMTGPNGCDKVREILKPHLLNLDIRLENKPQSDWVHIDDGPVPEGGSRYFVP